MLGEDLVRIWYSGFFSGSRRQYECAWVWGQVPGMLLSGQQHAVQVRARLASGASTSPEDLTISLALGQPGEAFHVMTPVQR